MVLAPKHVPARLGFVLGSHVALLVTQSAPDASAARVRVQGPLPRAGLYVGHLDAADGQCAVCLACGDGDLEHIVRVTCPSMWVDARSFDDGLSHPLEPGGRRRDQPALYERVVIKDGPTNSGGGGGGVDTDQHSSF